MLTTSALRGAIQRFRRDDSGAVTVDYVVLTAAVVGLGVSGVGVVTNATNNLAAALSQGVTLPSATAEE